MKLGGGAAARAKRPVPAARPVDLGAWALTFTDEFTDIAAHYGSDVDAEPTISFAQQYPLTEDGHVEMPDEPGLGLPIDHDYITSSTTQKW